MKANIAVGVAGFQGDVEEHVAATKLAFKKLGMSGSVVVVKTPEQVKAVSALIIPGGESTVIGRLSIFNQSIVAIRRRIKEGMPVLGTCAGLIVLAKRTYDRVVGETGQPLVGVLDVVVERNSFGGQRESFEADLDIPKLGKEKFRGVFIRSPLIVDVGPQVETLCSLNDRTVAVQQDNIIGTAFHPELSGDTRLHEYFIRLASKAT